MSLIVALGQMLLRALFKFCYRPQEFTPIFEKHLFYYFYF